MTFTFRVTRRMREVLRDMNWQHDSLSEQRVADDNLERRIRREMGWGCLTCGVLVAVIWALFCLLIEAAK